MSGVAVWPSLGTTVTMDDGITVIGAGGTVLTLTAEVEAKLRAGVLLTYDPRPEASDYPDTPTQPIDTGSPLTVVELFTRSGSYDGQVLAVRNYDTGKPDGGGLFRWDATATTTHDTGTCVGTFGTGRWKRIYSGALDVRWFGALCDGTTDDTAACQAAIDAGYLIGAAVYFPPGQTRLSSLGVRSGTTLLGCGHGGFADRMNKSWLLQLASAAGQQLIKRHTSEGTNDIYNVTVRDMRLSAPSGNGGTGLALVGFTHCDFSNLYIGPFRKSTAVHSATDSTNVTSSSDATNLATAITLANEIKADYNAHRSQSGVHAVNDAGNAVSSANATDEASLVTLVNEIKADFNAHRTASTVHSRDDVENVISLADATDTATAITLVNALKAAYNYHRSQLAYDGIGVYLYNTPDAASFGNTFENIFIGDCGTAILNDEDPSAVFTSVGYNRWHGLTIYQEVHGIKLLKNAGDHGGIYNTFSGCLLQGAGHPTGKGVYIEGGGNFFAGLTVDNWQGPNIECAASSSGNTFIQCNVTISLVYNYQTGGGGNTFIGNAQFAGGMNLGFTMQDVQSGETELALVANGSANGPKLIFSTDDSSIKYRLLVANGGSGGTFCLFHKSTLATQWLTSGILLNYFDIQSKGALHAYSDTAVPAGGTAGAGLKVSSTDNLGVFFGSGAPALAAAKGSLYLRTDGSGTGDRLYVNTNGSTTWTAVTTAA